MKHTEIEFKWDANSPRAFTNMREALSTTCEKISLAKKWKIVDTYLETPSQTLTKQQIAFRVRHVNQSWEATFKTRTEIKNGKAVRREETLALPDVKNISQALRFLQHKKTWKGLQLTELRPIFTLKNRRETYDIILRNMQAELAFDTCELNVCGRRVHFKEIELEHKKGSAIIFEKLAAQLTQTSKLKRAEISKVKTAFLLLKLWGEK